MNYKGTNDGEIMMHDDSFVTFVTGKEFKVTSYLLKEVISLQCAPNALTYISDDLTEQKLENEMFVNLLTNTNILNSWSRLTLMDRIFHLIMCHTLRPISSKYSTIFTKDLWFMHHIKRKTPINLANFIFIDMMKIIFESKLTLLYGQAIC